MMHKPSQFKVLSECKHGYIGICNCCREFNFCYKTVLITFQEDDMINFFNWLINNRHSPDYQAELHCARKRIFSSPHSNLFLVFSDDELEEMIAMFRETQLMLEAYKVVLHNRLN